MNKILICHCFSTEHDDDVSHLIRGKLLAAIPQAYSQIAYGKVFSAIVQLIWWVRV